MPADAPHNMPTMRHLFSYAAIYLRYAAASPPLSLLRRQGFSRYASEEFTPIHYFADIIIVYYFADCYAASDAAKRFTPLPLRLHLFRRWF